MNERKISGIALQSGLNSSVSFCLDLHRQHLIPDLPAYPAGLGKERDDQQPRSSRLKSTEKDRMYLNLHARQDSPR